MEKYTRNCPKCGQEITYKWKSDMTKANKKQSCCKKCNSGLSTRIQKGSKINDLYNNSKNNLDKLLEETIDSFYWLGFIIADGCFNNNRFELGLSEKDLNHLNLFKTFINFDKDLRYREKTKSYRLQFDNRHSIPKVMEKYGIVNAKTYNPIDFSIFKKYSKDLITALLIGIIDGDGTIAKNGSKNARVIHITAHKLWKSFYEELINFLDYPFIIKEYNGILRISLYQREFINKLNMFNCPKLNRKWIKI